MTRFRSVLVAPLVALFVFAPSAAYAGSGAQGEGSVPSEVETYVTGGSLVAQLDDVYGIGADGDGIDFDETTEPGVIERVHVWSAEQLAGVETEHPLELVNEWVVPISIDDAIVGLATIWINPATVDPELASFVADPELAEALSAVEKGASLVHDAPSAAWLALADDGTLTPLVPGSTGLSTPVPLDDVALLPAPSGATPPSGDPGTGVGFAIAVVLILLVLIVIVLIVPVLRKRPAEALEPEAVDVEPEEVVLEPEDVVAEPEVVVEVVEPAETPAVKPKRPKKAPQNDA
jgi:hypothetical protein